MSADDEARAAAYRVQQVARAANKARLEALLAGDPALFVALVERWSPLVPDEELC
jgi:hypothetical protein